MTTSTKVMEPDSLPFKADRLCAPRCTALTFASLIHTCDRSATKHRQPRSYALGIAPVSESMPSVGFSSFRILAADAAGAERNNDINVGE
jgi:hypothetical protein